MSVAFPDFPLVSVVIPTYERPELLREALASAVAQTWKNLEILVCDNASSPATTKVVEEFNDARIIHHRRAANIGMTANVQGGFLAAKGKYVANLHDDDTWEPQFVEKMASAMEAHPKTILAFSDHYIIDADSNINREATLRNNVVFFRSTLPSGVYQPFIKLALVQMAIPFSVCTMFRREAVDWSDFASLPSAYDFWLAYLSSRNGGACYYLNEKLASYRHHGGSESALGRIRYNEGITEVYRRMMLDDRMKDFHDVFRPRYADHYRDAAVALLRSGDRQKAREYLAKGISIHSTLRSRMTKIISYLPHFITAHFPAGVRFK